MDETKQNEFKGWAKVEVMGHQSHIGYVTTEVYGTACLFRIDQPAIPEIETVLERSTYLDQGYMPKGTKVKRPAIPAASVLVGSASIYRITPCTEEAALHAIANNWNRPLIPVGLPEQLKLTQPDVDLSSDDDGGDDWGDAEESLTESSSRS